MPPRPAELLILAALAFSLGVEGPASVWSQIRSSRQELIYRPMFALLLICLCGYSLPLMLVAARKLGAALRLRQGSGAPRGPDDPLHFDAERRLLRSALRFLRDTAPFYAVMLLYPGTDQLILRLRGSALADPLLIRWELRLFGGHLSVWMQRLISPVLTDVLSLCYSLHIVLPVYVFLYLHFRAPRSLFVEAVQGFTTMALVGFALYVVVPAVGPGYTLAHLYSRDLQGGAAFQVNDALMDALRATRDVFPSLHVGLSAILLVYAWRASPLGAAILLPPTVGNWISTVYLRYHYVVDLLAGFLLVPLVYFAVQAWMRRWPVADEPAMSGAAPVAAEGRG